MPEVAALVLAAGRASRYRAAGGAATTKLVADYRGKPLVRWAVEAALASQARPVVVVTGHARAEVKAALAGLDVRFVDNPDFAAGLSTSLRAGIAALPPSVAGAVVLLGDMPDASAPTIDALIAGLAPDAEAVVPVFEGKRGNPALLARALFARAALLTGDEGARGLLAGARVVSVEAGRGVALDIDAPADLGFAIRDARPDDDVAIAHRRGDERGSLARARAEGALLVAQADGKFAGFAAGWVQKGDDGGRFGWIAEIDVLDGYRRRGAGAALLRAMERSLAALGATRLRLDAQDGASAFFKRAGFVRRENVCEKTLEGG